MSTAANINVSDVRKAAQFNGSHSIPFQKWGSWIGGGALIAFGLVRRSPTGFLLAGAGGALAVYGTRANSRTHEMHARSVVTVDSSPDKAFSFWRNFENLPRFMHHLESVTITSEGHSHWVAIGPLNTRVQWDAEIIDEREGQLISWRSLPGSELNVNGSVVFRVAPANRGTFVTATTHINPPGGVLGHAVAKIFGKDPSFLMRQDMRRFKALLETGEVPTTIGQSHGPRDAGTALARLINPDESIKGVGSTAEAIRGKRRAS